MHYLHITGTIDAHGGFSAGWWSAASTESVPNTLAADDEQAHWQAVALDEADETLSRVPAPRTAQPICPGGTQWRLAALLPVPDDAASVAVLAGGNEVLRRAIPPPAAVSVDVGPSRRLARHATTVDVGIEGPTPVPGAYLVANWGAPGRPPVTLGLVPVVDREAPVFPLDLTTLPGGDGCRLMVSYFDGIRQTTTSADDLFLETREPVPVISSPGSGMELLSGAWLDLQGRLDGDGDPDSLEWFADDESVGTGTTAGVTGLGPGTHTITLRYHAAEVAVEILVRPAPVDEAVTPTWEPPWRSSPLVRASMRNSVA